MHYNKKIHRIQTNSPYTWIYFKVKGGIGIEWLDRGLPYPNYLLHTKNSYYIGWCIAGAESKYTHELRARFIKTLEEHDVVTIEQKPLKNANAHTNNTLYRLNDFKALESIKTRIFDITNRGNLFTVDNDEAFLSIKFYCEYIIKRDGVPTYLELENYAIQTFPKHKKGISTLKAKCRSIYNWYADRNFKIGRASQKYKDLKHYWEETMASRKDHMIKVNKDKAKETKRKILNLITGMFKDEYKKQSGEWNISKIAKESNTARNTVYKYIKEIEDKEKN